MSAACWCRVPGLLRAARIVPCTLFFRIAYNARTVHETSRIRFNVSISRAIVLRLCWTQLGSRYSCASARIQSASEM